MCNKFQVFASFLIRVSAIMTVLHGIDKYIYFDIFAGIVMLIIDYVLWKHDEYFDRLT